MHEEAIYAQFLGLFCEDLVSKRKVMVVDCWEEMVDCVEVEACVFQVRKEASFVVCYGVSACVNLVFGEVSDFLVSLRPNFAVSVTDESHFEEVSRNGNVHHSIQSQSRE